MRQLSGGMKQKLALVCTLVHEPELVILDEPTTGVDPLSRRAFWVLVADLLRDGRTTAIVSTAYMEEASRFDRVSLMFDGRIVAEGEPAAIEAQRARRPSKTPSSRFCVASSSPNARRSGAARPGGPARSERVEIEAVHLSRAFGRFVAVDDVSFQVRQGEIFGLVGANGAGKSCIIRMLTGILAPTSGTGRIGGVDVRAARRAVKQRIGYMSQAFSLYRDLTVAENIRLYAGIYGLDRSDAERLDWILEMAGLGGREDTRAEKLPIGLRQRLALGCALVHRPEILFLDEPTSGVDPIGRRLFWDILVHLTRVDGAALLFTTHYMSETERCDRLGLMHAGRLIADAPPDELRRAVAAEAGLARRRLRWKTRSSIGSPRSRHASTRAAERRMTRARVTAIARKEWREIVRDRIFVLLAFLLPVLLMLVLGYGLTQDVENIPLAVVDEDRSAASREYARHFTDSRYFSSKATWDVLDDAERLIASGRVRVVIVIGDRFERDLNDGRTATVQTLFDGTFIESTRVLQGYVDAINAEAGLALQTMAVARAMGVSPARAAVMVRPVRLDVRYLYNQEMRSVWAIAPSLIMNILMWTSPLLVALSVVREKERGSIYNIYASGRPGSNFSRQARALRGDLLRERRRAVAARDAVLRRALQGQPAGFLAATVVFVLRRARSAS